MDALFLSRIQFAAATGFHFLFVPLTLGLSILLAIMEYKYVKTGQQKYRDMAKFWGKLFFINFVLGVVTGISLEFQFGTNWARYSKFVGDIFGSLLAIEAIVAFFLESTFVAVWHFGWNRIFPKLHFITIVLIALASNVSAFWILLANGWMQHPVGYVLRNGRAELDNFFAVITNSFGINMLVHTLSSAYILAGFFVMGISAYHILKKQNLPVFKASFEFGMVFALIFSLLVVAYGHLHGMEVAQHQPAKLAAMESHWETSANVSMPLFLIPDEKNERNNYEILPVPGLLSFLAFEDFDATVTGLKDFPVDERPPVAITFWSFRFMVFLGMAFIFLSGMAFVLRNKLEQNRLLLWIMLCSIPLPYIAIQLGWIVAEVGRQPWIVYGVMKTRDAVSHISDTQVLSSLIAFIAFYTIFGILAYTIIAKFAAKAPEFDELAEVIGDTTIITPGSIEESKVAEGDK